MDRWPRKPAPSLMCPGWKDRSRECLGHVIVINETDGILAPDKTRLAVPIRVGRASQHCGPGVPCRELGEHLRMPSRRWLDAVLLVGPVFVPGL
jgi:hypothetical protein